MVQTCGTTVHERIMFSQRVIFLSAFTFIVWKKKKKTAWDIFQNIFFVLCIRRKVIQVWNDLKTEFVNVKVSLYAGMAISIFSPKKVQPGRQGNNSSANKALQWWCIFVGQPESLHNPASLNKNFIAENRLYDRQKFMILIYFIQHNNLKKWKNCMNFET